MTIIDEDLGLSVCLTGLVRCGQCGRMMQAFSDMGSGHPRIAICTAVTMRTSARTCASGLVGFASDRATERKPGRAGATKPSGKNGRFCA